MEPILTLRIDALAFGGDGVGRSEGKVCFVPYSAVGDLLSVRVVEDRGSFLRGEIVEIREPGPGRREPRCGHFGRCGGCCWQHLEYAAQLKAKETILTETMGRIGGLRVPVRPVVPSGEEYGYRTRTRLHRAGSKMGYFERSSKSIIEIVECPILAPALEARLKELRSDGPAGSREPKRSFDAAVEIELDEAQNVCEQRIVSAHTASRSDPRSRQSTEVGDYYAFRQVNRFVNRELARLVADTMEEQAHGRALEVVDLYCGNGNLSLPLAATASSVRGFDTSEESIRRASQAARSAGLDRVRYARMDAASGLRSVASERASRADDSPEKGALCVIADPPRSGLKELAAAIAGLQPELFIYVSCNPPALARDSRFLVDAGMGLDHLQPLDMFPQTFHLETMAVFKSAFA